MNRRYLTLVAIVLMALGILAIAYGYGYVNCPIPTGSTTGGTCVVIDWGIVGPGVIILGVGVAFLVVSLLTHQVPPKEQTIQ